MSSQPQLPWQKSVPTLPKEPGVYWFSDNQQNILYVGKAKNLKNRVSSYQRLNQLSSLKQKMVQIAEKIQYQTLASEIEALLIEAELIRLHQPEYNILLKDDKTYPYICVK
ncbi:MAG TPA: GIY-YIG nuclease family protein, partial [Candidatus Woesebacteria bacterium]|nr:GIY-YIG nuclease family protein [Candidatus Woesebacteria bacterium]